MNEKTFKSREEFRAWLAENALSDSGLWLIFDKTQATTLSANDALEEALCFGWIDGQIQSIDEKYYKKYFKQRSKNSKWSEKNKELVKKLETQKIMTNYGREKVKIAKENNLWDSNQKSELTQEHIYLFESLIKPYKTAFANFTKMSKSVQKTYTSSYFFGAKTEAGKQKRLTAIIERLNLNLNPMEKVGEIYLIV